MNYMLFKLSEDLLVGNDYLKTIQEYYDVLEEDMTNWAITNYKSNGWVDRGFILPNGDLIEVPSPLNHYKWVKEMLYNLAMDHDVSEKELRKIAGLDDFGFELPTDYMGWLRVNGRNEDYVSLPPDGEPPTSDALNTLRDWIEEFYVQSGWTGRLEVTTWGSDIYQIYDSGENFKVNGDYIINKIKRFYSAGKLEESKNTSFLNEIYDRYPGDSDKVIEDVVNKAVSLSDSEIFKLVPDGVTTEFTNQGPYYITNDRLIDVSVADTDDTIHSQWLALLMEEVYYKYFKPLPEYKDYDWWEISEHPEEDADYWLYDFTYNKGWIRVNCGGTSVDERFYCVLPKNIPNSTQFEYLMKFFDIGIEHKKQDVIVYAHDRVQRYKFNETFPEDIIKKIKRFYSSGTLYENAKELEI